MNCPVAIVGMACRLPDAPSTEQLWENILNCRSSFKKLERQRWIHSRFYSPSNRDPDRTYAETAALIDDVELFAGSHFGVAARRAEAMDPQQRILLELVYQALQDAGLERREWDRAKTATFIGASLCDYKELNLVRPRMTLLKTGFFGANPQPRTFDVKAWTNRASFMRGYTFPGSITNMCASLIAQTFDLGGPAYVIDAACASSLISVARGVEYLRGLPQEGGLSPVALAGGVYLSLLPDTLVAFARVGAVARRECRPFDAQAEGFVLGEGAGLVVLKRLADAERDGDRIYAVIQGVAVNSDGKGPSPLSPRLEGQVALFKEGLADSGVDPATIDYLECHGTATATGDEIELKSITQSLGNQRAAKRHIGSVKANIGHCMSAAGIAGLLRATLAVYHATLPPQAGFKQWHPSLEPFTQGFQIDTEAQPWKGETRRAIVSAFGFGGINSLAVLESAPARVSPPASAGPYLFCFSAPTPELLLEYRQHWMEAARGQSLSSLAYTQTLRRNRHRYGSVIVARQLADLEAPSPIFPLTKPLPLTLSGASVEDRQWLAERGVPLEEEGFEMNMEQPEARLVALGTATLLGHAVQIEDQFEDTRLADLPAVPLARQRYWIVEKYEPDPETARLFAQVANVLECAPDSLQPELQVLTDLAMNPVQLMELQRCLSEEFGHQSVPNSDFWETDPNLGQVSAALTRAALAPQLPLDLSISNESYPFVMEYSPNGRPLLPLAYALDLLTHAVGGQLPLALEKVALRRDIQVQDETLIRLTRNEDELRILELKGPREVVAFSGRVGKLEPAPEPLQLPAETHPTSLSVAAFYRDVAFQGPLLQGILELDSVGKSALRATVKTSTPGDFLPDDPRQAWTIDPLLVDSALQMAVYWSHVERGKLAVAQEVQRVIWLLQPAPGKVEVQWRVVSETENEILSTAQFIQEGRTLGWLEGVKSRLEVPRSKVIERQSLETLPGYVELQRRMKAAKERGFSIPYFQMHDEVKGVHSQIQGRDLVNFSSYNYVGLSGHPQVTAASIAATERFGTSVSASRLVAGERPPHRSLERKIADFLGTEDALVLVSGYLTNVTIISHLMSAGDLILYDSYSHDCILKGVRASGATRQAFPHNDMEVLEERLSRIRRSFGRVLVVVEGVYSMDGDFPDLARLVELRDKYNFWLLIDEAHSLGTMGQTGRGLGEHYGVARDQVDLWSGTLSKALASCGGYVAGRQELIEYLKYTTPGFVYSVGMPPSNAAAAQAALEILQREPERVRDLQFKSAFFLDQIRKQGLDSGLAQGTPVVPVILGDSAVAWELARELALRGINTCPIVYPAVEEKSARLRFFITNLHTEEQLEYAARVTGECLADLTVTAGARI